MHSRELQKQNHLFLFSLYSECIFNEVGGDPQLATQKLSDPKTPRFSPKWCSRKVQARVLTVDF